MSATFLLERSLIDSYLLIPVSKSWFMAQAGLQLTPPAATPALFLLRSHCAPLILIDTNGADYIIS